MIVKTVCTFHSRLLWYFKPIYSLTLMSLLDYNYFICKETTIQEGLGCEGKNEIRAMKMRWKQKPSIQGVEKHWPQGSVVSLLYCHSGDTRELGPIIFVSLLLSVSFVFIFKFEKGSLSSLEIQEEGIRLFSRQITKDYSQVFQGGPGLSCLWKSLVTIDIYLFIRR